VRGIATILKKRYHIRNLLIGLAWFAGCSDQAIAAVSKLELRLLIYICVEFRFVIYPYYTLIYLYIEDLYRHTKGLISNDLNYLYTLKWSMYRCQDILYIQQGSSRFLMCAWMQEYRVRSDRFTSKRLKALMYKGYNVLRSHNIHRKIEKMIEGAIEGDRIYKRGSLGMYIQIRYMYI
jgi:hypothetical protein